MDFRTRYAVVAMSFCIAMVSSTTLYRDEQLAVTLDKAYSSWQMLYQPSLRLNDIEASAKLIDYSLNKYEMNRVEFEVAITNLCKEYKKDITGKLMCKDAVPLPHRSQYQTAYVDLERSVACHDMAKQYVKMQAVQSLDDAEAWPHELQCTLLTQEGEQIIPPNSMHVSLPLHLRSEYFETNVDINALLIGPPGVGKSTSVMTFMSALTRQMVFLSDIGHSNKHVTRRITKYPLSKFTDNKKLRINLWDTWGITDDTFSETFLNDLCAGKVMDSFEMSEYMGGEKFDNVIGAQMTVVLFFMKATQLKSNHYLGKLQRYFTILVNSGYRPLLVITWIHELGDIDMQSYLANVCSDLRVEARYLFVLHGYTNHKQKDVAIDREALRILQAAVSSSEVYLRAQSESDVALRKKLEIQEKKRLHQEEERRLQEEERQRQEEERRRQAEKQEKRRLQQEAERQRQEEERRLREANERKRLNCEVAYQECADIALPKVAQQALTELSEKKQQVTNLQHANDLLQKDVTTAHNQVQEFTKQIAAAAEERNVMKDQLTTAGLDLSRVNANILEAQAQRDAAMQKLEAAESLNRRLDAEHNIVKKERLFLFMLLLACAVYIIQKFKGTNISSEACTVPVKLNSLDMPLGHSAGASRCESEASVPTPAPKHSFTQSLRSSEEAYNESSTSSERSLQDGEYEAVRQQHNGTSIGGSEPRATDALGTPHGETSAGSDVSDPNWTNLES